MKLSISKTVSFWFLCGFQLNNISPLLLVLTYFITEKCVQNWMSLHLSVELLVSISVCKSYICDNSGDWKCTKQATCFSASSCHKKSWEMLNLCLKIQERHFICEISECQIANGKGRSLSYYFRQMNYVLDWRRSSTPQCWWRQVVLFIVQVPAASSSHWDSCHHHLWPSAHVITRMDSFASPAWASAHLEPHHCEFPSSGDSNK